MIQIEKKSIVDGASRCFGQTCLYLDDINFNNIFKKEINIILKQKWKKMRKKSWILSEILHTCGGRIKKKHWIIIDEFINIMDLIDKESAKLIADIIFHRFEGLSLGKFYVGIIREIIDLKTNKDFKTYKNLNKNCL